MNESLIVPRFRHISNNITYIHVCIICIEGVRERVHVDVNIQLTVRDAVTLNGGLEGL